MKGRVSDLTVIFFAVFGFLGLCVGTGSLQPADWAVRRCWRRDRWHGGVAYPLRRAVMGLTREALRAGRYPETRATVTSASTMMRKV